MLTRRQTLQTLGVAGLAAPLLDACSSTQSVADHGVSPSHGGIQLVGADVARSPGDPQAAATVAASMREFTLDLWDAVGEPVGNLALSPYSIAVALAMTANGAHGDTAQKMEEVLHIGSLASYNAGMAALTQALAALAGAVTVDGKTDEIALDAANQLFGDRAIHWQRAFLTVLAKEYGAGMRTVDFQHDAEGARTLVNAWTAQQTHDRIQDLLPPGSVDATSRLVLVNALYFKAPWDSPFVKASTSPGLFTRSDGTKVTAQLMVGDEGPTYVEGLHFRGGRLPYAGGTARDDRGAAGPRLGVRRAARPAGARSRRTRAARSPAHHASVDLSRRHQPVRPADQPRDGRRLRTRRRLQPDGRRRASWPSPTSCTRPTSRSTRPAPRPPPPPRW